MLRDRPLTATRNNARPSWRLHLFTIIAMIEVAVAVAQIELTALSRQSGGGPPYFLWNYYGWPETCFTHVEEKKAIVRFPTITYATVVEESWDFAGLLFDVAMSVFLLFATGWTLKRWLRRECAWWQFSLRSIFVVMTVSVLAIAICFGAANFELFFQISGIVSVSPYLRLSYDPFAQPYCAIMMVFAVACGLYCAGSIAWQTGARFSGRRKPLSNTKDELHVAPF